MLGKKFLSLGLAGALVLGSGSLTGFADEVEADDDGNVSGELELDSKESVTNQISLLDYQIAKDKIVLSNLIDSKKFNEEKLSKLKIQFSTLSAQKRVDDSAKLKAEKNVRDAKVKVDRAKSSLAKGKKNVSKLTSEAAAASKLKGKDKAKVVKQKNDRLKDEKIKLTKLERDVIAATKQYDDQLKNVGKSKGSSASLNGQISKLKSEIYKVTRVIKAQGESIEGLEESIVVDSERLVELNELLLTFEEEVIEEEVIEEEVIEEEVIEEEIVEDIEDTEEDVIDEEVEDVEEDVTDEEVIEEEVV